MNPDLLIVAAQGAVVFDLSRPYTTGMPHSPNHPAFRHALDRRHGDRVRPDGGSAAADIITTGCDVGTHVDALAHVSHDGYLQGGVDAAEARVDVVGSERCGAIYPHQFPAELSVTTTDGARLRHSVLVKPRRPRQPADRRRAGPEVRRQRRRAPRPDGGSRDPAALAHAADRTRRPGPDGCGGRHRPRR